MAQNVESNVYIKINADTGQVELQVDKVKERIRELVAEAKQGKIEFADFSESLDNLANGFSQLGNSTEQVSENMEDIGESSGESAVNIQQLTGLLGQLANGGKISASTFEKLGSALGLTGGELVAVGGAATVAIGGIKLLADNTKEMINTFTKVGSAIGENAFQGIEWFVDSLQDMAGTLDDVIDKLQEFADMGIEIQNSYIGLGNFVGTDALQGLDEYANALESIIGLDATGVIADMDKLGGAIIELGATSDEAERISKSLYELALNIHGFKPSISTTQAIEELTKALQTGKITKRQTALYSILKSEGVEAFNALGDSVAKYNYLMENSSAIHDAYQKYLETDAGKIEILRQQYSSFMGNIGQIALHLYATIAPVLTAILQLANGVLSALMKIFNINVRTSTGAGGASGLGGLKKDIDEVGKSAGKATKQLASFDDVIQINDSKSGGSALGDIDTAGLGDFGSMLDGLIDDSNELTDIWAKFKELLEQGDYFGAGTEFMHVIGDLLRSIDWDKIKSDVRDVAADISRAINGLFDEDARKEWEEVGKFIGEAINTAFAFLKELLQDVDFKDIGKSLGAAWSAMWDTINAKDIADTLYYAVIDAFDLLAGWLEGGGLSKAASKIAEIIKGFFTNFSEVDLGDMTNTVVGVVDDILNAIKTVVDALTSDDVKEVVFGLITRLVTAFKENAGEWGTTIHDIVASILDFIIEGFETADKAGVIDAVLEFIQSLKLDDLLSKYLKIKWEIFKIKAFVWFQTFVGTIIDFFLQAGVRLVQVIIAIGAEILLVIGEALAVIIGAVLGFGTRLWNWLTEGTAKIGQAIGTFLGNIIGKVIAFGINIGTSIASIGTDIGNKFSEIGESIKSIFSGIWDFVSGIFDPQNWIDLGTAAINALWSAIKSIWNNTIGSWSFDIPGFTVMDKTWDGIHFSMPKLATGGIVTSATTALIGEAGREAVLPLDNNTQWMDRLATKLANQINSGAGQSGGTVRVELSDKPFYTRAEMYEFGSLIVESLKAYGLNIAIV